MLKEMISARQMICVIVMFLFGNSVIIGVSSEAGQDSWQSVLLVPLLSLPMLLVFARIIKLYPGKDLFEIMEIVLGKIGGKILAVLMAWFAFHVGALVLRSFSEFIQIVFMPETPQLPIMIAMMLVVAYMIYSGIEAMGRCAIVMFAVIVSVVILTSVLSANIMDFSNIFPFMEHDFKTIILGSYRLYANPFGEMIIFVCLASALRVKDSSYKIFFSSLLIGVAILLVVMLRNLFVLGPAMLSADYFPSYMAVRVINVGDFMARIEGSIAINFILAGIVKISVCVLVAAKGLSSFFGVGNYRHFVFPLSLWTIALGAIAYHNVMEVFAYKDIYGYYFIPFEILIPLLIWIVAEIKHHGKRGGKVKEITF